MGGCSADHATGLPENASSFISSFSDSLNISDLVRKSSLIEKDRPYLPQPPPILPSSIVQVGPRLLDFAWSHTEHPYARRIPGFRPEAPAKHRSEIAAPNGPWIPEANHRLLRPHSSCPICAMLLPFDKHLLLDFRSTLNSLFRKTDACRIR